MKKFATTLVQINEYALHRLEQKLLEKRQLFLQIEEKMLKSQQDLSAFSSPILGNVGLFLQTQHLKNALRIEIGSIKRQLDEVAKDIQALEQDYVMAHQELEKAKFILENEVKKATKLLEKKEQALLDESALILHFAKKGLHA
ncbi:flagellar export protein FliJ [Helicobacter cetorum]|uniref:Flagellar FliJ protein n=1 Tax=Helicobacter cetorum (strain ATCC BAA-429 / MIT 00-7128) TaxID=182217 RepID=I0EPE6_HELC0|nr:flagellar export protein FliJ [Helicobacter cetorum]AFI04815.1 hypothetical protein HCW_07790 [Helicobacter cetorum MIT 00-7128]